MGPSTGGGGPAGGGEPVGGGSASGGNGQGGSFDPGGDEGCGCTTPGGRNSDLAWLALLGLGGLALRRRRRS
jgi:MYXO-CTERM domain-containing protein